MSNVYVAKKTAVLQVDGKRVTIRRGLTRVREGHPLLDGREDLFEPLTVHYDVEQASAAPGEKRDLDLTAVREWAKENGYDVSDRGKLPRSVIDAYQQRDE